jgi:hypothetical protein
VKNNRTIPFFIGIIAVAFTLSGQVRSISPFVQIPFELRSGYLIFSVPAISTGPLTLLFDTGCQTMNVSKNVSENRGNQQPVTLVLGTRKLTIDNYRVSSDSDLSKRLGQKIDGIIGNDILFRYQVKIDYKHRVLSLFDSEELVTSTNGEDIAIGVNSLVSSVPLVITFSGGKRVKGEFVIDTGAPINVTINSPFVEKNGLSTLLEGSKERKFKTQADIQTAIAALAESIRIGRFECVDKEIFISTSTKGLFAGSRYAGIVGNKFFQNFTVIFDYMRKRLHIDKR